MNDFTYLLPDPASGVYPASQDLQKLPWESPHPETLSRFQRLPWEPTPASQDLLQGGSFRLFRSCLRSLPQHPKTSSRTVCLGFSEAALGALSGSQARISAFQKLPWEPPSIPSPPPGLFRLVRGWLGSLSSIPGYCAELCISAFQILSWEPPTIPRPPPFHVCFSETFQDTSFKFLEGRG